jgi:predicted nucleotidyltransferase|tara:strand:- start:3042 stop:3767 length:726 start_codon:yes stop_codon:yes gene_type:complete
MKSTDKNIINSFKLQDELIPDIWFLDGNTYRMKPEVRDSLLQIVKDYIEFTKVDIDVDDITLTGSLANFNWSEFSDVDVHILVDFEDMNLLFKKYLDSKRMIWNSLRDVTVKDFDVEVYVQSTEEPHFASGVYSILYDEWIVEPVMEEEVVIDSNKILEKSKQWMEMIDSIENDKNRKEPEELLLRIDKLKNKLKKYRSCGLKGNGEYSYENLTFKFLRRNDYLKKINDIKNELIDKSLTV